MQGSVLIVEDEPHIAEALSFLLGREGLNVSVHADGRDAVTRIGEVAPDLVILDAMLPNKSGFDILIELRASASTTKLPVMMLTAKGQAKDRAAAEAAGVTVFMAKPFSNSEIVDTVKTLLP